ncbi:ABC transporter ATP-binding protein [Cruoricaptor ignavus]|uniref:ABC transporter ATP-binding protein n=1 Tax=Cruoricaptor ignavus TaxID=1118202 RepID=UPI00370CFFB5
MPAIIQIQNLSKKYKNAADFSIRDISLEIQEGEIFGLLGPNGAGKTTLISILCGLIQPTSGRYEIAGFSPDRNLREIQKIIGIIPQEYALYPSLTATENLMFFGSLFGLKHDDLKQRIKSGLERVGLSQFADRKIAHFSGGMKRRCNILAGLLHQPKILFLDEPTVGVDVQSRALIIDFLKDINQAGTTIIYTSHHLLEAQNLCTEIAIIDHGKIFAQAEPQNLIASTENATDLEGVFIALTGKKLRDAI